MTAISRHVLALAALATIGGNAAFAEGAPKVLRLEDNLAYGEHLLLGASEEVHLPEYDATWSARIDTGAETTSIHATDITSFERDGDEWVRFQIRNDDEDAAIETEKKVERYVLIRKRGDDGFHRRPVVRMDFVIGEVERRIEVNLTDRTGFEHPILIGRNYLSGVALVDVSRDFIQDTPGGDKK